MQPWAEAFYNSKAWRKTRAQFLEAHPYCERCAKNGDDAVVATVAHHREWLTPNNIGNPAVTLAWDNLEALCRDCHYIEHHPPSARAQRYEVGPDGDPIPPRPGRIGGGYRTERGRAEKLPKVF